MISTVHILPLLGVLALMALSACEMVRTDEQPSQPQDFLGASTKMLSADMVQVTVGVLHPTPGAMQAYADCVGSQYALIRGMDYARRVSTTRLGNDDVVTDHVTYLISPQRPSGDFVLTAREVVTKCKSAEVPTF